MSANSNNNGKSSAARSLFEEFSSLTPADAQQLMQTMMAASRESHGLLTDIMGRNWTAGGARQSNDPLGVGESFTELGRALASNPATLMQANMQLWQTLMSELMTMAGRNTAATAPNDKRFSDPEWTSNPALSLIKRMYQINSDWLLSLVDAAPGLDEPVRRKAKFFTQQSIDAFAPSNFFATNPQALRRMLHTGGDSVLDGLRQARADIKRGNGKLTISHTDETAFELGENVATAKGRVVFKNDLIELIQYKATTAKVYSRPLLIFPPWINKFYILDLREENSMVRWLRDKGYTVYVVSWRSADDVTKDYTWSDYVEHGAYAAVGAALKASKAKSLNAVGYCIGGTMLTSALAHMAQNGDRRVKSATYFASQMDFENAGDLLLFTDNHAMDYVEDLISQNDGVMPGESMTETFNWLRPVDLVWRYVVDQYLLGKKPRPFDLLFWNSDQTNIPGPTHRTYLEDLYANNALAKGKFSVLGERLDVSNITVPVFVQAGRDDHICPYGSVYRTATSFGGPGTFVLAGSGHIAGVVNHPNAKKYQHWTNDALPATADQWLSGAEEHPGSWWPTWHKWLRKKSGKKIPARKMPKKTYGKAPGQYAKRRLADIRKERGL